MKTHAHIAAVFRVPQRAGADGDDFVDAEIFAVITVALEYFEAAPFAFRRDHSRTIDALAQPGNFRQIVQDSEATGVSYFSDQAENRIGADVDESRSSWTHRVAIVCAASSNSASGGAAVPSFCLAQAVMSARARRDIISFFALPCRRTINGGIKPKFTFIG